MNFQSHRPQGHTQEGDPYLPQLARELTRLLIKTEGALSSKMLCLPNKSIEELATVLVEFAEDVHNSIGIWKSLERYNLEFFGTPLPLVLEPGEDMGQTAINGHRIRHLLWVLYSELRPERTVSPTHPDLNLLATVVSDFLVERFATIPRGSAVKAFLQQPNQFGWDVKRKLVWLGRHSYLFRNSFRNYVQGHGGAEDIPIIDDYICQQTTNWSGLGVIDILAATLDISQEQRSDLRNWYDRHLAYYRVLAIKGPRIEVLNKVNDKPYTVEMGQDANIFGIEQIVLGSLVPWNKEWYWSGKQWRYDSMTDGALRELKDSFVRKSPRLAYRYCDDLAEKAKESVSLNYHEFVKYHGDDLAVYPDGLSMAADLQKEIRLQWESKPAGVIAKVMEEHKLTHPWPSMSFPHELTENENGVGVYYDADEGQEMMTGFNDIVSGLKKKGGNLSSDEEDGIRSFICSDLVSPEFVRRLVKEYGYESVESAFLIRGGHVDYHLDYLLRRYKGDYYRKRYPRIALV
jgi:hypothetical protein